MAAPTNTLLIEGSFEELASELASFIDNVRHSDSPIQPEIAKLLEASRRDEVLRKLVVNASILNSATEKAIVPAYNLLLHLARQAPEPEIFFAKTCDALAQPFPGSPQHGTGLALTVLTTMFNITPPGSDTRYHVLLTILRTIRTAATAASSGAAGPAPLGPGAFDAVRAQLAPLDAWLEAWDVEPAEARKLLLAVAQAGSDAGDADAAYAYTVRALRTFVGEESDGNGAAGPEAKRLALAALRAALEQPTRFDFQDLAGLDAVQALRRGAPEHFALLELFTAEQLDDLADFRDEHPGWLEKEGFDVGALVRKMRLLTLASLAASSGQARALTYDAIARALRVPEADVEVWVIDVIRAGLVEGKLSQLSKQFLIHRSTYRVFGDNQWREIAARLDMWKTSLTGVLAVVREERKNSMLAEPKDGGGDKGDGFNGESGGRGERGGRGDRGGQRNRQQQRLVEADD